MILSFELSMPRTNSWNGRWSGEGRRFVKCVNVSHTQKAIERGLKVVENGPYHYSFGDGWVAGVKVEVVDAREAAKLRKLSAGFCGYDWMIDSIREHGEIKVEQRRAGTAAVILLALLLLPATAFAQLACPDVVPGKFVEAPCVWYSCDRLLASATSTVEREDRQIERYRRLVRRLRGAKVRGRR